MHNKNSENKRKEQKTKAKERTAQKEQKLSVDQTTKFKSKFVRRYSRHNTES